MPERATETEVKYDLPAGVTLPRFEVLPGVSSTAGPEQQDLAAEYFDTGDLRLLRAGITLRRRTGGSDAGWHLKLPAGVHAREEIRLPLGCAGRRVPRPLAELVRSRARGAALVPVATLLTRRRVTVLLSRAGESLAEVAEDEVTASRAADPASVTCWRELEVELTGGDLRLLDAAGVLLRRAGLRPPGYSAKLERALGVSPPSARQRPLTAAAPAHAVVAAYLRQQAEALAVLDPAVRAGEPDAVHQMRVATRRLRSTLRTFAPVLGTDTGQLAGELQWLGGVLGEARDAEVQADRLLRQLEAVGRAQLLGPVQQRVQAHFAGSIATAQADVARALNSARYLAVLDDLDAVIAAPPPDDAPGVPAARALRGAVRRAYRKTRRRMASARRVPPGPARDAALHQARKAAKQARYAAEAVASAGGRDARRFAAQMKSIQSVLGEHQDAMVARQLTRGLGAEAYLAGENAFSYGVFCAQDEFDARRLQRQAELAWKKASRRRYRRWLSARYDAG